MSTSPIAAFRIITRSSPLITCSARSSSCTSDGILADRLTGAPSRTPTFSRNSRGLSPLYPKLAANALADRTLLTVMPLGLGYSTTILDPEISLTRAV
ncbi:MAG: hypothetical protein LZ166_05795 [Thaumarchaeota archaeon]|nr:hypothetical protein [Nitrososphaerota archaeon]MCL7387020.1 hypothetical protein [Candidatus Wolframiiraptor allenii]MCL7393515.1 hypothetical protein [Candidatus Wolframiiraptor allenii]